MSKKSDEFYFDCFMKSVECSCRGMNIICDVLENYSKDDIKTKIDEVHKIENEADSIKHDIIHALNRAFITPIESEDIIQLSEYLDNIADCIDDVLMRVYIGDVDKIRPEALKVAKVASECCETLKLVMDEFHDFKKSKKINDYVIKINDLEEDGDALFIENMHTLYVECRNNPVEIIIWSDIYNYLERCIDSCEHVADVAQMVVMKNS